jgi:hypothetical protein
MPAHPWRYLDRHFYSAQAGRRFRSRKAAFRHYQRVGYRRGLDPHRLFCTDWYRWQNPDWQKGFADPFSHFVGFGAGHGADPSFLVDMVAFRRRAAGGDPLRCLSPRRHLLTEGVYPDLGVLEGLQARFLAAISPVPIRVAPPVRPRPYLIHLQAGSSGAGRVLCEGADREYDLLMNYYRGDDVDPAVGEYSLFQIGTKFTAAFLLLRHLPVLYRDYRYVLFLDDDIVATPAQLNALFRLCEHHGLALAQASLTPDSHCVWPALFQAGGVGPRFVNAVEIMMPVLSAEALRICGPRFGDSVSGFGLDLLFGSLVGAPRQRVAAVLDDVAFRHQKPIEATGSFYEFLRANHINPKAELWRIITEHGLERQIRELPPVPGQG